MISKYLNTLGCILVRHYSFHPEESRPLAVSTDGMSFHCLFPIISYCGGISPLGGLDTVVLPAGHSTQGDLSFVTYRLHGILRPSNLTLGDVAIY